MYEDLKGKEGLFKDENFLSIEASSLPAAHKEQLSSKFFELSQFNERLKSEYSNLVQKQGYYPTFRISMLEFMTAGMTPMPTVDHHREVNKAGNVVEIIEYDEDNDAVRQRQEQEDKDRRKKEDEEKKRLENERKEREKVEEKKRAEELRQKEKLREEEEERERERLEKEREDKRKKDDEKKRLNKLREEEEIRRKEEEDRREAARQSKIQEEDRKREERIKQNELEKVREQERLTKEREKVRMEEIHTPKLNVNEDLDFNFNNLEANQLDDDDAHKPDEFMRGASHKNEQEAFSGPIKLPGSNRGIQKIMSPPAQNPHQNPHSNDNLLTLFKKSINNPARSSTLP